MSDAGLTNGAFYAHFSSKNELVEKSLERATDEQWHQFEKEIASGELLKVVRAYLSEQHRDHPGPDARQPRFSLKSPASIRIRDASTPRA